MRYNIYILLTLHMAKNKCLEIFVFFAIFLLTIERVTATATTALPHTVTAFSIAQRMAK